MNRLRQWNPKSEFLQVLNHSKLSSFHALVSCSMCDFCYAWTGTQHSTTITVAPTPIPILTHAHTTKAPLPLQDIFPVNFKGIEIRSSVEDCGVEVGNNEYIPCLYILIISNGIQIYSNIYEIIFFLLAKEKNII